MPGQKRQKLAVVHWGLAFFFIFKTCDPVSVGHGTTHTWGRGQNKTKKIQYFEVSHRQTHLNDGCRKQKSRKKGHMIGEVREEIQKGVRVCGDNINTHLKQWSNPCHVLTFNDPSCSCFKALTVATWEWVTASLFYFLASLYVPSPAANVQITSMVDSQWDLPVKYRSC